MPLSEADTRVKLIDPALHGIDGPHLWHGNTLTGQ
jgi:hypothetical protein